MPFVKQKKSQSDTQDLSSGPVNFTTTYPSKPFGLQYVSMKFSQAISETVTVSLDSVLGAAFDDVIAEVQLVSEKEFTLRPQGEAHYRSGDQIRVQCTNNNLVGTASTKVVAREIQGG